MQHEIAEWLQNPTREYEEGTRLLDRYGRNRSLHQHLVRKETRDNWTKLEYELRKMAEAEPVLRELEQQGHVIAPGSNVIIIQMGGQAGPPAPAPEPPAPAAVALSEPVQARIEQLMVQAGQLHTQQAQLSNSLADQTSDEARKSVVEQIDVLKDQRAAVAQERQRLEAGGALQVEQAEAVPTAPSQNLPELLSKRNNLRTSVSKAKKEVTSASGEEKRQLKQVRLDKLQVQLADAELQVKAAQAQQA